MTIDFEDATSGTLLPDMYGTAEKVITAVLDYIKCPYEVCVGLTVTDNEEIHRLNYKYRQIDSATDVLSFPMTDFLTPGDFGWLESEEGDDCFDPDTGELILGDIVISADKVLEQAASYGHSATREYAFLITHSMLHLVGYDHMTQPDAEKMEQMQNEILDGLLIPR